MADGPSEAQDWDLHLVLGGARSGKSRFAEQTARAHGKPLIYIATAEAHDDEMRARIAQHQEARGSDWQTIEGPQDLAAELAAATDPERAVLIDCLTLWLSNRLLAEADLDAECEALVNVLDARAGPVVAVSNEVGLSIVPDNALARRFRDAQGRLNQAVASVATHVTFIAAGLPLTLKSPDTTKVSTP